MLEKAVLGGYITTQLVESIPDYKIQQQFMPEAIKAESKKRGTVYNDFAKGLDGELKKIFNLGVNDQGTVEYEAVRQYARRDFDRRYELNLTTMSPPEAAQVAAFDVASDIKDGKGLSEEQEQAIAAQAAQAAAQITGKAQQQAVLEQQLQAAQDPVVQQQQAELQVKQAKIKQEDDDSKRDAQVEIEKAKMRSDLESKRLKMQKAIADDNIKAQLLKNKRQ